MSSSSSLSSFSRVKAMALGICLFLALSGYFGGQMQGAEALLVAGTTTFFDAKECPPGWTEINKDAAGRLLVSVTDSDDAGITVGMPLADREDRQHRHHYNATVSFAEKDIAAIDCCDKQAAAHGDYTLLGLSNSSSSGYPMVQLLACTLLKDDPTLFAPFGTIAYFSADVSSCPAKWQPLDQAAGRVLVPSFQMEGMFESPSPPLKSAEDRVHSHTISGAVSAPDVSFAGVEGCCNHEPAHSGNIPVSGDAAEASSGLPYIQMLTCLNFDDSFNYTMPGEALLFNSVYCPGGWVEPVTLSGRMPVALPTDGEAGATFGGNALLPHAVAVPNHTHIVQQPLTPNAAGVGLDSGCCGSGYAAQQTYQIQTETSDAASEFPYIMAPLCVQEGRR